MHDCLAFSQHSVQILRMSIPRRGLSKFISPFMVQLRSHVASLLLQSQVHTHSQRGNIDPTSWWTSNNITFKKSTWGGIYPYNHMQIVQSAPPHSGYCNLHPFPMQNILIPSLKTSWSHSIQAAASLGPCHPGRFKMWLELLGCSFLSSTPFH